MAGGERTIAVLSPGEMGSQVGRALRQGGARVVTCVSGRSEGTARRASEAGLEALLSLDDVVRQAELVISVVPSLSALPLAEQVAGSMARLLRYPLYLDANSIGPSTAERISGAIAAAGGQFVDGSIIGGASDLVGSATFYLSGEHAEEAAELLEPPLHTEILGHRPGQASGFKVLYAGMTKGLSALGVELLAGAERLGLTEKLTDKYRSSLPSVSRFLENTLPGLPQRAGRRSQEMIELAEALEELGLSANMPLAAQATLEALAARYRERGSPDGDGLLDMVQWWTSTSGEL